MKHTDWHVKLGPLSLGAPTAGRAVVDVSLGLVGLVIISTSGFIARLPWPYHARWVSANVRGDAWPDVSGARNVRLGRLRASTWTLRARRTAVAT